MSLSEKQMKQFTVHERSVLPSFPVQLSVEAANACNHSCRFCANHKITKPKTNIDLELANHAFKEAYQAGSTELSLSASGEPLIHPNLHYLVAEAKKVGFPYVFINTNGMLATRERAFQLMEAGLDSVKFSVNAGTEKSYHNIHGVDAFQKVIDNIRTFAEIREKYGFATKLYTSFVAVPETEHEYGLLEELIGDVLDERIHYRSCSNQGGNMMENNDYSDIEPGNILGSRGEETKSTICSQLFNRIILNAQGLISACCVDYQNALIIADYRDTDLETVWQSDLFQTLRQRHIDGNLDGLICKNCIFNTNEDFSPVNSQYFASF